VSINPELIVPGTTLWSIYPILPHEILEVKKKGYSATHDYCWLSPNVNNNEKFTVDTDWLIQEWFESELDAIWSRVTQLREHARSIMQDVDSYLLRVGELVSAELPVEFCSPNLTGFKSVPTSSIDKKVKQ
jgi:hypothetical protein